MILDRGRATAPQNPPAEKTVLTLKGDSPDRYTYPDAGPVIRLPKEALAVRLAILPTLLLLSGLLLAPAVAAPVAPGPVEGTRIALDTSGDLGFWTLEAPEALQTIRQHNPALSNLRLNSHSPGDAVAPGGPVRMLYGGMDRSYVSLLRYRPHGRIELALKNAWYNRLETRSWIFEVAADHQSEGAETWISLTSREPLSDQWFEDYVQAPQTIPSSELILGSGYTWYRVLDQTGMRIDTEGGAPVTRPLTSSDDHHYYYPQAEPVSAGRRQGQRGSRGPVDPSLLNPYAEQGGMRPMGNNPYYTPWPRAQGWGYNPFLYHYGWMPYYSPYPIQVWAGPGVTVGTPYYLYDHRFGYGQLPGRYYINPTQRGLRTNFGDVLFSADIGRGGLILRGISDFIEGELNLGQRSGFALRLRGVRDLRGNLFQGGQPVVVYIDGMPYYPAFDPRTGQYVLNFRRDPRVFHHPQIQGGLGSRIRIQPADIRTGQVGIEGIELEPVG